MGNWRTRNEHTDRGWTVRGKEGEIQVNETPDKRTVRIVTPRGFVFLGPGEIEALRDVLGEVDVSGSDRDSSETCDCAPCVTARLEKMRSKQQAQAEEAARAKLLDEGLPPFQPGEDHEGPLDPNDVEPQPVLSDPPGDVGVLGF